MKVRRVVTGHSPEGKAIFASDELVEPIVLEKLQGNEFHRLWGGDAVSAFPDDGSLPANPRYFPPVGGFRFAMGAPDASVPAKRVAAAIERIGPIPDHEIPSLSWLTYATDTYLEYVEPEWLQPIGSSRRVHRSPTHVSSPRRDRAAVHGT